MCSIIASFSSHKLSELLELNRYRGEHSSSKTYYDINENRITTICRKFGFLENVSIPENCYCIAHQQAPTTEVKDFASIHPAEEKGSLLWHNGILKPDTISKLQFFLLDKSNWDSYLLLRYINQKEIPNNIDGSFSCIYWDHNYQKLYIFRNEIAPLFIDNDLNISSTKFDGSSPIKPNIMYELDIKNKKVISTSKKFNTVENPYNL